ncbi:MAG: flavodoxin family protein [Candidatus Omnitrophica bacterium]|nr:flavodoxin family protein [Candidatus Omnitrophota bacterium]
MYVLGINGSPRIGGNTDILLDKALEGAKSKGAKTKKIILNKLKFSACQECDNLKDDGSCIIEDDMQPIYKKIEDADAIILASPIFFGSLSAQMKTMIDRFQCIWRVRYILKIDTLQKKKKGAFISVEGSSREDFFDNARSIVKNLFAIIGVDYNEELFCPGVNEKASVLKHQDILKKAFELGQRVTSE